ncbi:MAG: HIT domain-containing protein [Candidatus Aenigmarchaeota archaeon]|nr:HIT domain-containing protein [Candidatus Aenigmarchaeota archaeon]
MLCSKCNRSKGDKDQTDFREDLPPKTDANCPFCTDINNKTRTIEGLGTVVAIRDKYPVTTGHCLVVTRRHTPDFFTMTLNERMDAENLLTIMKKKISKKYPLVTGFNIGANCGISSGQTVMHAHFHLIPRRHGDTPKPKGGVRGVIPAKMAY